jgi:hypothetical protein
MGLKNYRTSIFSALLSECSTDMSVSVLMKPTNIHKYLG